MDSRLLEAAASWAVCATDVFDAPVLVEDGPFGLRSVRCAMDAIEFLEEWPIETRCELHRLAGDACCAAYDGRGPVEIARASFLAWARAAGVAHDAPLVIEGSAVCSGLTHS